MAPIKVDENLSDPLGNSAFKKSGFLENLITTVFGIQRPLQCLQVEVTSACMGKCVYCPHTSQKEHWRTRHISAEIYSRLWTLFRHSQQVHLQGWGEPLLHPRFMDFVRFAKKAGCDVSTTSCGLIMKEELAFQLAESGMNVIAFSLTGTDEKSNRSRANVDFTQVCKNIQLLREALDRKKSSLEIHLAYLLLADQIEALEALPELIKTLGIDCAVVSTLDYLAHEKDRKIAFMPEDVENIERAREVLTRISKKVEQNGKKLHFALPGHHLTPHENGCRENIRKTLYVDAEGDVSPCIYLNVPGSDGSEKRRVYGNVLKEDPLEIWKKADFVSFRKMLVAGKPEQVCEKCPKRLEIMDGEN